MRNLTIEITTGFLGEEWTLKTALQHYIEEQKALYSQLKIKYGKEYIPNQHLPIAAIKNCKALLKKLESK